MNLLLTIALYIIVIIHITFVPVKVNSYNSDDEEEPLIDGKESNRISFARKNSKNKFSKLSLRIWNHNGHGNNSVRRPSVNQERCALDIKSYLGRRKIHSSLYSTVWSDFKYINALDYSYADYMSRIITHINLIRILYGACPLVRNPNLDRTAQFCANKFAKNYITKIHYEAYGVYKDMLHYLHLADIVSYLYSKRVFYNYRYKNGKKLAKKFTQLIWKSTTQIGIGITKFRGYFYIVLIFYPKGNIEGQYENNVSEKGISWKELAKSK